MAHNSLAPGFVKVQYTFAGLTHHATLPVIPSGFLIPSVEPSFVPNGGGTVLMGTAVDAWIDLVLPFFGSGTDFISAEFWSKPTPESDPVWIYTHPIGESGSAGTAGVQMLQHVTTYRTAAGGLFKQYFMEVSGIITPNTRDPYPFTSGGISDLLADYLIGTSGWIYGRDGGKIVLPLYATAKTNDALRKRRLGL